jgi:hypothetical protein
MAVLTRLLRPVPVERAAVPSYPTLRRFMRANGLDKRRRG